MKYADMESRREMRRAAERETIERHEMNMKKIASLAREADSVRETADNGALHIVRQGVFSAGGTVTKPIAGEYNPALTWQDPTMAGNTAHVDHANVFYQIPAHENGNPMVYLHGHAQSRICWQCTPDGREGWSDLFLRMGHAAFLVDQPRRGEAGMTAEMTAGDLDIWPGTNLYKPGDHAMYTHFRIGLAAPERYEGSQFPAGERALNQFFRQMTPNTGPFDLAVCVSAMGATLEEVRAMTGNKAIFVTHSQSGPIGWQAPKENIAAIVAIEPGGMPKADSPAYQSLLNAKIPIAIYFGDYIDNGPEESMATGLWRGVRERARAFAEQFNADGGDCMVVNLPDEGITGNSHFLFQELNNAQIAERVEAWLDERGLAG